MAAVDIDDPPVLDKILTLDDLGDGRTRARHHQINPSGVVFGGAFLGQALAAAQSTAQGRTPTSLRAVFLKAGNPLRPIDYAVSSIQEGRTFSARNVLASQDGSPLMEATASFQTDQPGFGHSTPWSAPPPDPESLVSFDDLSSLWGDRLPAAQAAALRRLHTLDIRAVDPEDFLLRLSAPKGRFWIRTRGEGRANPYAALAFVSDFLMPAGSMLPHVESIYDPGLLAVSLNHTIWFHGPPEPAGWLLHELDSPWAGNGRGLTFGRIHDRQGRLLASTAQEMVLRSRISSSSAERQAHA